MPVELERLNKKRIDHRHHAMDAIVIACCTRMVQYLNNENAKSNNYKLRNGLAQKLCNYENKTFIRKSRMHKAFGLTAQNQQQNLFLRLLKTMEHIHSRCRKFIKDIVVSFHRTFVS